MAILFSVIIPTYKPKAYIWQCLKSFERQSMDKQSYEIIIVLNGCFNPWYDEIERYINNRMADMHVRLIQTDMPGVSNARNMGINEAEGDYIVFMDDDDYVSETFLERLYEKRSNSGVAVADMQAFSDEEGMYEDYSYHKMFLRQYGKANFKPRNIRKLFNGPVSKLIPRETIGDRRFDPGFRNGEDALFMFQISDRIQNCQLADSDAVYYRRMRPDSATTRKVSFGYILKNELRLFGRLTKIFFTNIGKYDFLFYVTRILGGLKVIVKRHL